MDRSEATEDARLVRQLQAGQASALDRLVERHDAALLGFVRTLCLDDQRARDIAQDAWIRGIAKRDSLRDGSRFRAWLFRIAQRQFLMSVRDRRTDIVLDEGVEDPEAVSVLDVVIAGEDVSRLHEALGTLSPPHRAVIWLHVVEELSHVEIAQILEIAEGTARSRLHYGLRRVKDLLGQGGSP
jgi:RNA polymerase sigma-70 factor, ECF subfamily